MRPEPATPTSAARSCSASRFLWLALRFARTRDVNATRAACSSDRSLYLPLLWIVMIADKL